MLQKFVDRFMESEDAIRDELRSSIPDSYDDLVRRLIDVLSEGEFSYFDPLPDPNRITVINEGDWQGTLLFVIGAQGYQPSTYWSIFVSYGSCGGCDTFQAIMDQECETDWHSKDYTRTISNQGVQDLWTMMLHMVQSMKRMDDE